MKIKLLLPAALLPALMVSCSNQATPENYDVSNPYAAPDYGSEGTPFQDVNPVYDSAPAYEDTASLPPAQGQPSPTRPTAGAQVHTVVRGDTLWGLSRQYGVSIDAIKAANNLTRDTVMLGQRLQIPAR